MKEYNFNTAYTQAKELYGITLNPDEFETLGLIAWDKIGNRRCRLYKFEEAPSVTASGEYYIDLPCNVDIIEAVTTNFEDYQRTSPLTVIDNPQLSWAENYIEGRKFNTSYGYVSGQFIKYFREENRLWLSDAFKIVRVFYKGVLVDEAGLPSLNEKELDAIAAYCMFVDQRKRAAMTMNPQLWQTVPYWEKNWKNLCTQARVPDYINQNEMDEILNAATTWDRKRFGRSFKVIK